MDNNFVNVGKWGECLWGIDENGNLFINEGLAESIAYENAPWAGLEDSIITAEAIGEVRFREGASLMGLFKGCKKLERADLSGFVTDNVVDMSSMFEGCANLKELDISSFDTRRCQDMRRMFGQCARLDDILIGEHFSLTGNGETYCDKLAIKEYGKYRKAKTISVEGFRVFYHSNNDDEKVIGRNTVANYRYIIEDQLFDTPSDRALFLEWNTRPDAKGDSYEPGSAIENVDQDIDLYAIWAWAPEISEVTAPRPFQYGERIPFELPKIVSVNDPEVMGFLEISKNGEEGTWHAIDHNTILPVSFNGYMIRLHASNRVGEAVSNAVRLSIRKASIDTSGVRWAEPDNMVYNGKPKEVHVEGLPAGIEPRYEGNVATEAGKYVATFAFDFDENNFKEPLVVREYEWTIKKATLDMSQVRWTYEGPFNYDGSLREVKLTGLPAGVSAIYSNNTGRNAGIYTATAVLEYDYNNYEKPADIVPCTWEIKRATIDPRSLEWSAYDSFVFDGTPKTVEITNLPDDVQVEYEGASESLAGKYLARATLVGNYCTSGPAEYEWEIAKAQYDMSNAVWSLEKEFIYDGESHGIELRGVPERLRIRYRGNEGVASGRYSARASFINPDMHNYMTPDDITMSWQINRRVIDMSGVRWDYEGAFTYDGENKAVRLMNVPEGIGVEYEGNVAFNAGEYNAHAILRFDEDNLEVASPADCQWRINKRRIDISGAYWDYAGVFTYDGQEHGVYLAGLPDGLNIDYTDNVKIETGSYVASASLSPVDPFNFEVPEVNGCSWAIRKADRALGKVEWTDCGSFVYDGKLKRVEIESGLDDDIMVEYESESAVNAGKYFAKAYFSLADGTNHNPPKPVGYSWSIAKAHHDMSHVVWDYEKDFTYDGSIKRVRLLNVPDGVIVKYRNEAACDAGTYTALAQFEVQDDSNYEPVIPDMTLEWTIKKAEFDLSNVKWQGDRQYAYDGEEKGQKLRLVGLPDGLTPIYTDTTAVSAGEYTARASFRYDEKNYVEPQVATCHWVIEKSPFDLSNVFWAYEQPFVYDGSEKRVLLSEVPDGAKVEYVNATAVNAGTYVAAADIVPVDTDNRIKGRLENLTWRIERGEYDMSHAHWDYEKPFVYDGSEHKVVIKGLPEGVTPTYRGNVATDAGDYRASVTFTVADEHNYAVPQMESLEWSVAKADCDMSAAAWNYDGEFTYTGRMYEVILRGLPEGVRAVYTGNAAADVGSYEATAVLIPYDQDNYNRPVVENCKWRISKADYEMSAVRWDYDSPKTFNGREQNILLEHLPGGVTAEYYGNTATDVGQYTARAELFVSDPANYNVPSVSDCDWEIIRSDYDMSDVSWDYVDGMYTFDGSKKTVQIKSLPEGVRAIYSGNSATLAGEYVATASFTTDDNNFNPPEAISIPWRITKADYDMSNVRWDYKESFVYDGAPKRVELIGLPDSVTVTYIDNTAIDAGVYTAVAQFSSDIDDYNIPPSMSCTWSIGKADVDIRRLAWDYSQSFIYDGFLKKVELKGVPDLLKVSYSGNSGDRAGKYLAHAELIPVRPDNYNTPVIRDCSWEISKADYDMSDARWDDEVEFTYDGTEKSVSVIGLPYGVRPVYRENKATEAGLYTASVDLECDSDNYNIPHMSDCKWKIDKASYDMSNAGWHFDSRIVYDGTVKSVRLKGLPAGLEPVYTGNEAINAGEYEASVDFIYDDMNYVKPSFTGCKWKIAPADIAVDLSDIHWKYSGPFEYDGTFKTVTIAENVFEPGLIDRLRGRETEVELAGIPDGFDVVYENNIARDAGIYYAKAKLVSLEDNNNYNELELPSFRWEITKARVDMSGVRWNYGSSFVYDGIEKSVELLGLPDTVTVKYTDNTGLDAGEHEAMAQIDVKDPENYETPRPVSGCWWQIDRAKYDMSDVHWVYEDDMVYNGKEKRVRLEGLPDGVKVEAYRGNKGIEAGLYTAEAIVRYSNKDNYEEPSVPALKWRIRKKKIDLSDVRWDYDGSTKFVFDEKPKEVRLTGLPKDVEVAYIDNCKVNAGTYTARARLIFDTRNCEADEIPELIWKIDKAVYDLGDVFWTYDRPFRYDGTEKSITLAGVPSSISVRYRDNKASAIGTYTAKAYLTYDNDNYEAPEVDTTIDWAIIGKEVE